MKPKIFVGSSKEGLNVAYSVQQNLTQDAYITVWNQGVFKLSNTSIESLVEQLDEFDFAIFIFTPDDITQIRETEQNTARDNVIFELGLFIGKLGRKKVFFIKPSNIPLHIPSDLLGVTYGVYDNNRGDGNLEAATAPACHQIRTQIQGIIPKDNVDSSTEEKKEDKSNKKNTPNNDDWMDYYLKENYKEAIDILNEKLQRETDEKEIIELRTWRADCIYNQDIQKGIDEINNILATYSTNPFAYRCASSVYQWHSRFDKAISIIEASIDKFKNDLKSIKLQAQLYKEVEGEEKALELLLPYATHNDVDITLSIVDIYESQKEYQKARDIIHNTYMEHPKNETIILRYAKIADELSLHDIAYFLFKSLTRDYPDKADYWGHLANSCVALKLNDIAWEAYHKADEIENGEASWIISNIGNLLNFKGIYSEAIKYLNRSIEIDKNSDYALNRLSGAIKNKELERDKADSIEKESRIKLRKYIPNDQIQTTIEK